MVWVRRGIILLATVVSLAFAGDNTSARVSRTDSADVGPLAIFSVADRVPMHVMRDRIGLGGLSSVPDPFVDVVSLAVAGLGLLGIGRRLSRHQPESLLRAEPATAVTKDSLS